MGISCLQGGCREHPNHRGKSKTARRMLPLIAELYRILYERWEAQGRPSHGWVFPSRSESGHFEEGSAKIQHARAINALQAIKDAFDSWQGSGSGSDWHASVAAKTGTPKDFLVRHSDVLSAGVKKFEPYCLRHTALTRLAEAGCDAFTLARIAGHSSITITQRYCHPQAEAIEASFGRVANAKAGKSITAATVLATSPSRADSELPQVVKKMVSAEGIEHSTY